jgi:membrane-associated phospholipid phosphatase
MTTAAAAAVPMLRAPLIAYAALIALTRITFGAHFPLDVLAGAVLGYELGLFSSRLLASARLLPATVAAPAAAPAAVPRDRPGEHQVENSAI